MDRTLGKAITLFTVAVSLVGCAEDGPADVETTATTSQGLTCVTLRRGGPAAVRDAVLATDPTDPTRAITNYGAATLLTVGAVGAGQRQSILWFDTSPIPASAVITSATLGLTKVQGVGGGTVAIHTVMAPWSEPSVTYASFAGAFDPVVTTSFSAGAVVSGGQANVDLTGLVQGWRVGTPANHGILLEQAVGRSQYGAAEAPSPAQRPQLTVCYAPPTCGNGVQDGAETGVDCGGSCAPCGNPCANVVCVASDACHLAGSCNPSTGQCSNPVAPWGTPCDDGSLCTSTDTCQSGACVGASPVVCTASDACHVAGTCDPTSGQCSSPDAPAGTPCNDGDLCTQLDTCQSGLCVGASPVVCTASDACHAGGTCSPQTGTCSNPVVPCCSDGLQNQGETGVDCGGPCGACATCADGLQNQGETGVDCGGPCGPCAGPVGGATNPGLSCWDILAKGGSTGNGLYWIKPDGGAAFTAYCDMTGDSGGWTKLASASYSFFFSSANWQDLSGADPMASNYSALGRRQGLYDEQGCATFRFVVGNSGTWQSARAHYTVWKQCHDPFTASSTGSDYSYVEGDVSSTCGGFNGLHNKYTGFSFTSDPDTNDSTGCWWMQVVPSQNYNGLGYLEGYGGANNYHQWQSLWMRGQTCTGPDCNACNDGVQNGQETGVDCGGPCQSCSSTASGTVAAPALSCADVLANGGSFGNGRYWVKPDGGPMQPMFCDMTKDGGGWTKLESTTYPAMFSAATWQGLAIDHPEKDNYSALGRRAVFADSGACTTFRFEVGDSGNWRSTRAHYTVWEQCHDPFTATTTGSDYTYYAGDVSSTCGGFNGLHNKYTGYSFTSDSDTNDAAGCWWMQVVPSQSYNGLGYLEGYGGSGNYHQWQSLWVSGPVCVDGACAACFDGVRNGSEAGVDCGGKCSNPCPSGASLGTAGNPGLSCRHILDGGGAVGDGLYWITPQGSAPIQVYCDMTTDGGGYTKLMSVTWPTFFSGANWQSTNAGSPLADFYSILGHRASFADGSGCTTFRLSVGNSGNWTSTRAHFTVWKQCHDPFTATTAGLDFTHYQGELSTTCGGFNGLHHKYQGYSFTSDPDANDSTGCWWMQVVPSANYNGLGYLEGYGGSGNYHQWQSLWAR